MNVKTILSRIDELVIVLDKQKIETTISDYQNTIVANKQNIVVLKDLTNRLIEFLDKLDNSNIEQLLNSILNTSKVEPFTAVNHQEELREIEKTQKNVNQYFAQLNQKVSNIKIRFEENQEEIDKIIDIIGHFNNSGIDEVEELNQAIISIIFNHQSNIKKLKNFNTTLSKWTKMLPLYHQLILSSSPQDIELYSIESGSIDVLLGIDPDVAKALMEVFKAGIEVFTAYLVYKTTMKEITKVAFQGNQKLIDSEKEREEDMLKNIKLVIQSELRKQHEEAKSNDNQVSSESIDVKINQISDAVEEHVVKGNDLKLIEAPTGGDDEILELDNELQSKINKRKIQLAKIETTDWNLLLEAVINGDEK